MAVKILPKRIKKHPNAHWHWWQILGASIFAYGVSGSVIGLLPPFSVAGLLLGLALAVVAVVAALWSWWNYEWWARFIVTGIWTLMFFAMTARAWTAIVPSLGLWLVPFVITYLLSWALPIISPSLSEFLWREQTTPQTKLGRFLLAAGLSLAPVAGTLGAIIGMFGSRFGELSGTLLIIAILGSIATVIITFSVSYQLWPERPWAIAKTKER